MKKILISIKPKWVVKILNGEKTIEVRKTAPKCELPCEVYIYCTKGGKQLVDCPQWVENELYHQLRYDEDIALLKNSQALLNGKVVAKFTLNKVGNFDKKSFGTYEEPFTRNQKELLEKSCLTEKELDDYLKGKRGYAWHIDNLVIFDKPKGLKEFHYPCKHKELSCEECVELRVEGKLKDKPYCHYWASIEHAPQSYCFCEVDE